MHKGAAHRGRFFRKIRKSSKNDKNIALSQIFPRTSLRNPVSALQSREKSAKTEKPNFFIFSFCTHFSDIFGKQIEPFL
jgi:hypothetical protein